MPLSNSEDTHPELTSEPIDRIFEEMPNEAGKIYRFLNSAIDTIIAAFLMLFLGSFITGLFNIQSDNIFAVIAMVVHAAYYLVPEYLYGKTVGKWITGTRVVSEIGEKADLRALVIRTLCRYIPFEQFSFLGEGTGWHDSLSGTRVVRP